jgi:hypothetical protein
MAKCYAYQLGDCQGQIEDEHFIPNALQKMMGEVTLSGLAWQKGIAKTLRPSSYAHARMICQRHHDQLDGLDGTALAYFRNLMLISNPNHVSSGKRGRIEDIPQVLSGRNLEKWFLKTICGALAAKAFGDADVIPIDWIKVLFDRVEWPDTWAMYVATGNRKVTEQDARFTIDFNWTAEHELNGIVIRSFSIETIFTLHEPTRISSEMLKRPKLLGAAIERPDNGDVLEGLPKGEHIRFQIRWPEN